MNTGCCKANDSTKERPRETMGSKWIHRLSNINTHDKTAICSYCGPVALSTFSNNTRFRCKIARNNSKCVVDFPTGQIGICPICLQEENLFRDHDHECCDTKFKYSCGQCFRGYICGRCNRAIAQFQDDPERLQRARNYLIRNKTQE